MLLSYQFPQVHLKQQWGNTVLLIENLKSRINIKSLRWSKPSPDRFKLITDGCSKGNLGSSGGGGNLRDDNGQLVLAYAEYYGECSNNVAESKAILYGIQWCITNGFKNVDIESDSMIIINMINDQNKINQHILHITSRINNLKKQGNFKFQHCYREVNNLADYLANLGERQKQNSLFTQDLALPNGAKSWLKNDMEGIPNFRIRAQRKAFTLDNGYVCLDFFVRASVYFSLCN